VAREENTLKGQGRPTRPNQDRRLNHGNSTLQIKFHKQDTQAPPNFIQCPGFGFRFPNLILSMSQGKPGNVIQSPNMKKFQKE
jgi:hypothetical protein